MQRGNTLTPARTKRGLRRSVWLAVTGLALAGLAVLAPTAAQAYTAPNAPTSVFAYGSNGSAIVNWTAPDGYTGGTSSFEGPWLYDVTPYISGVAQTGLTLTQYAVSGAAQTATVSGLTNNTAYTFKVVARSGDYYGPYFYSPASAASNSVTPFGASTSVFAYGSDNSAIVNWTAPNSYTGGTSNFYGPWLYTITPYIAGVAQTGLTDTFFAQSGAAQTHTMTGLTNGTAYTFKIVAKSGDYYGTIYPSTASAASNSVTPFGASTGVSATAGNTTATVNWTAPNSYTGGTSNFYGPWLYTITPYIAGVAQTGLTDTFFAQSGAAQTHTMTGLTNGSTYTFKVVAKSGDYYGTIYPSTASSASSGVTPHV